MTMKRLIATITLNCCIATTLLAIQASTNVADSLYKLLPTLSGETKQKAYKQIVEEREWEKNNQEVLRICDEWIEFARQEKDLEYEEKARNRKLTILYNSEDWAHLVPEAAIQREWMEQHQLWNSFYKAWRDIIEGYSYSNRPQTALREAQKMQDHAQRNGNNLGRALAYQQMGVIYDNINHAEAIKAFEKSISLMDASKEDEGDEMISAYYYLAQELDFFENFEYELKVCEKWKKHLDIIKQREHLDETRMNVHYLENYLWNASALIGTNRYDEADKILEACENINRETNDRYLNYQIQVHRAHLELKRGNIEKALYHSNLYAPMMGIDQWPMAETLRGEILFKAGKDKEAAQLYQKMYFRKDSTFSKDMRMHLDEFNTLFQLDEIRMKGQLDRSRFIIGIIALVLIALLFIMFLRHRAAKKLEAKNRELEEKNQQLTVANLRAEESSKMKTNFIQQISHEIRTPLNILSGFTQVITTPGVKLDEPTREDINQRITENTDRITSLVNKMLELSEASSHTVIERTDHVGAAQVAAQAIDDSGIAQARHIAFDLQLSPDAEETQLLTNLRYATRALALLLGNALKFTKQGSVHLIGTVTTTQQQQPAISFTVEDTGIGIPAAEAEHVFEEFVQLDEYYEGTGIGLTVARSIARRLGGDIVLDTSYTAGARFVMTLPI